MEFGVGRSLCIAVMLRDSGSMTTLSSPMTERRRICLVLVLILIEIWRLLAQLTSMIERTSSQLTETLPTMRPMIEATTARRTYSQEDRANGNKKPN